MAVGRRGVVGDIEDVRLAVVESLLARRARRQRFFFFLGVRDQMEIAGRNLAGEIIAEHALGDAEVHADARLARSVRAPRAVDVLLSEEAAAARLCLDLPAFLSENLGHVLHAEPFFNRVFDQLARPLDAQYLHRSASVLVRGHIDEGQPEAARGDAVAIEQAGVERKEELRRGREHDADVHEPLHRHGKPQFALRNDHFPHEAVQHPPKLRQISVCAELLGYLVSFVERDGFVQIAQVVQLVTHACGYGRVSTH